MIKKIKKFIKNREVFYPNIEIFSYFILKAIKKAMIHTGLIKPSKNNKDMFDWPLYCLHYGGELKKDAKTATLALRRDDYKFQNGFLIRENKNIKPLHPNHRFLYETIMQLNPNSIYEMGCGTGMHLHNMSILLSNARICGTDLLDIQLKYLNKQYPELINKTKQLDSTISSKNIPFKPCDVAFTQAVIMHIHTGKSHLTALENLFKMSKKYVVLYESMKNHHFLNDIKLLQSAGKINWKKIYFYYRQNEYTNAPMGLICSNVPLNYPELTDYNIYFSKK